MNEKPTEDHGINMGIEGTFSNGCCIMCPIGAANTLGPEQPDAVTTFTAHARAGE